MTKKQALQLFQERKVRTVWDDEQEKWYFSVVDVVGILTDSADPKQYIKKMRKRDPELDFKWGTICTLLRMTAPDGKNRQTSVTDQEGLFRIIQSIPSPKAEPFKVWMAQVASQRIDQLQDPELSINQAMADYKRLGYSDKWIQQRLRGIETRKELTDEWKRGGIEEGRDFASLTDIILGTWSGKTTREYKRLKGLHKESLRDNMTNIELALTTLAEASTTELSRERNPQGFQENAAVARSGGDVARAARLQLESKLGRSVISSEKASDYLPVKSDGELLPE